MKKVRLSELSEQVRSFLSQIGSGESVRVVDDNDQLQYGVTPYAEATAEEKRQAMAVLEGIWQTTGPAMEEAGITEDDVQRDLLEDD